MEEIIRSITEAEEKAAEIKAEAQASAAAILEKAEAQAAEISQKSESDCKIYREVNIRKAEEDAEKNYIAALDKKKAEAKAYADGLLKKTDAVADEIVRRIVRGSC